MFDTGLVFRALAARSETHMLALVWCALCSEAEWGAKSVTPLHAQLGVQKETLLKALGVLVKLGVVFVYRPTKAAHVRTILVRASYPQHVQTALYSFQQGGSWEELCQKDTHPDAAALPEGVYFADEKFAIYDNTRYTQYMSVENTQSMSTEHTQNILEHTQLFERGVGKTLGDNSRSDPSLLVQQIVDGVVSALQPHLPQPRKTRAVTKPPTAEERAFAHRVFDRWVEVMGYENRGMTLGQGRLKIATERHRSGHTYEEFEEISLWCRGQPFMRGHNKQGREYDDFDNLFASEKKFDKYLKLARSSRRDIADMHDPAALAPSSAPVIYRTM